MSYITLADAKRHLAMDHDDDDALIQIYVDAATSAVKNYLKSSYPFERERDDMGNPVVDSSGDFVYVQDSSGCVIDPAVKAATMILVGHFYKDRDNNGNAAYDQGYLPKPVTALLYPMRDPSLA